MAHLSEKASFILHDLFFCTVAHKTFPSSKKSYLNQTCFLRAALNRTIYNQVEAFETFQQSIFQQSIWFVEKSSFQVEVIE